MTCESLEKKIVAIVVHRISKRDFPQESRSARDEEALTDGGCFLSGTGEVMGIYDENGRRLAQTRFKHGRPCPARVRMNVLYSLLLVVAVFVQGAAGQRPNIQVSLYLCMCLLID